MKFASLASHFDRHVNSPQCSGVQKNYMLNNSRHCEMKYSDSNDNSEAISLNRNKKYECLIH